MFEFGQGFGIVAHKCCILFPVTYDLNTTKLYNYPWTGRLRLDLLSPPIPELASPIQAHATSHANQLLGRKFRREQLVSLHMVPIVLRQLRLHTTRVLGNRNGIIPRHALEIQIKRLRQARDPRLARAVRVPAAHDIVGRAADASAHRGVDRALRKSLFALEDGGLAGQEVAEVLEDQEWPDGVDLEALEGMVGVDLPGGPLRVQDAGDGVGEAEVVRFGGKHLVRLVGGGGDCEFICVAAGYVRGIFSGLESQ